MIDKDIVRVFLIGIIDYMEADQNGETNIIMRKTIGNSVRSMARNFGIEGAISDYVQERIRKIEMRKAQKRHPAYLNKYFDDKEIINWWEEDVNAEAEDHRAFVPDRL